MAANTDSDPSLPSDPPLRITPDQLFRGHPDGRISVDDYPSYGGTPARCLTPRGTPSRKSYDAFEAPRRSASLIIKSLQGLASARMKSGRLSDADELQASHDGYYDSARMSNASPMRVSISIAGPVQIPEDDLYRDVEAARAFAGADDRNGYIEVDIGKSVRVEKPPPGIYVKFTDVKYKVVLQQPAQWRGKAAVEKQIIHGITGSVAPGEMLAMMGPSGSGKTTLLNLLGSRKSCPQNISGSILYNHLPYTKNLKRRMGFVTQDDVLFPHLTVRETLTFSARLRLPNWLTTQQKIERAEDVLAQLGLQRCSDTVIGNQFLRGVSGGERKRVCIGQEILIDPSLIFLDEPTSGLDSTTALRIIQLLQNIAREGRTVVTTIHQPSSRAFHMFDKLILLSEGHVVYFGKARGAMTYFDSIGFSPLIPMNPADFLLDLCSGNTNEVSLPSTLKLQKPAKAQAAVQATPSTLLAKDVKKYLVDCCESQITALERSKRYENPVMEEDLKVARLWGTSWWEQFTILLVRGFKERRHEYLSWLRIVQVVLSALLGGCLWWQSKHRTPRELQDQVGLLFFIGVFWGYMPLFTAIFTFPLERAVLAKERASDMYRLTAYFLARTLGDLPLELALPFVFMTIIYFMTNLHRSFLAFLFTVLTVFLTVVTSQGVGYFIGAVMMDVQKATTFASVLVLAFMLAGGFFVQSIPPFIGWIKHLSFQAHTYTLLIQVQYGHETTYNCSGTSGCQNIASAPALSNVSLHGGSKAVMAMLLMVFGYRLLAYFALRRMKTSA